MFGSVFNENGAHRRTTRFTPTYLRKKIKIADATVFESEIGKFFVRNKPDGCARKATVMN